MSGFISCLNHCMTMWSNFFSCLNMCRLAARTLYRIRATCGNQHTIFNFLPLSTKQLSWACRFYTLINTSNRVVEQLLFFLGCLDCRRYLIIHLCLGIPLNNRTTAAICLSAALHDIILSCNRSRWNRYSSQTHISIKGLRVCKLSIRSRRRTGRCHADRNNIL